MENLVENGSTSSNILHTNKEFLNFVPELSMGDFQVADEVEGKLPEIMKAAKNNLVGAQTRLGIFYMTHFLCTSDKKAVEYFTMAARQGSVEAMIRLAILYNNERGVLKTDRFKADSWLSKAVALREPNSIVLDALWRAKPILPELRSILDSSFKSIYILDLANLELGDSGVCVIAEFLPKSKIHSLYLKGNGITNVGADKIASTIFNSHVKILDLWKNKISDEGLKSLSDVLQKTEIQALDLAENKIKRLDALGKVMPNCKFLRVLHLGMNMIGCEDVATFSSGLKCSQLILLDIGYNNLGSIGAEAIMKGVPPTLRILDLSENSLYESGAVAIANILPHKPFMRLLDLKKNHIGPLGGKRILEALATTNLEVLNLRNNEIDNIQLVSNLHPIFPRSLRHLDLKGNNIPSNVVLRISTFLNKRRKNTLQALRRDFSIIVPEGQFKEKFLVQKVNEVIRNDVDTEVVVQHFSHNTIKAQLLNKGVSENEAWEIMKNRGILPEKENIVVSVSFRSTEPSISKHDIEKHVASLEAMLGRISDPSFEGRDCQVVPDCSRIASETASFPDNIREEDRVIYTNWLLQPQTDITTNIIPQMP